MQENNNEIISPQRGGLTRKVITGGFWIFSLRISNRMVSFARTIILARLLSPDDFGLFGIAMLALSALERFSITGFDQALIQKKGKIESHLDTTWVVQIVRGFLIGLVLFVGAPLIAGFFNEPSAVMLMRTLGAGFCILGFKNVGIVYFRKRIDLKQEFIYEFSGTIADFATALTAAIILRNAWALILGFLARSIVQVIVSFIIQPFRPKLIINKDSFKELFSFGQWVWISGIFVFLLTQGDSIIVGKLIGVTALGFYQMAYKISNLPGTEITHIISHVTFPAYSRLQDNLGRLREAYFRVLAPSAVLSVGVGGLIFTVAPEFTAVVLKEQWLPIITTIRILVCWGIIRSIVASISPVFYSLGKPKIVTFLQGSQALVLAALIYPFALRGGIEGVALAVVISSLVLFIVRSGFLARTIHCSIWRFYRTVLFPIISAIAAYGAVYAFNTGFPEIKGIGFLAISAALFILVYGIIILVGRFAQQGGKLNLAEYLSPSDNQ